MARRAEEVPQDPGRGPSGKRRAAGKVVPAGPRKRSARKGARGSASGVGRTIREQRRRQGLSIRETAEMAGVTPSHLSQIERGVTNPSLAVLRKVATALSLPLTTFFDDTFGGERLVVRHDRRPKLQLPDAKVVYELLSPRMLRQVEFCKVVIEPGGETVAEPMSHGGEETALVEEGLVELFIEGEVLVLEDGDSVYIPPHAKHRWVNIGPRPAHVVFAISPPMF